MEAALARRLFAGQVVERKLARASFGIVESRWVRTERRMLLSLLRFLRSGFAITDTRRLVARVLVAHGPSSRSRLLRRGCRSAWLTSIHAIAATSTARAECGAAHRAQQPRPRSRASAERI